MPSRSTLRALAAVGLSAAFAVASAVGYAQEPGSSRIWRGGYGFTAPPRFATANTFVGGFNFCRLAFTSNRREKRGWSTDYPGADINLSVRLAELTKARVPRSPSGEPEHIVVRPTDDSMFKCPFLVGEDAGTAVFSPVEAAKLRDYFEKGGFLFVSDTWGELAEQQFEEQIGRVLPREQFPLETVSVSHPIFHSLFDVKEVKQMPSIQSWRRTGGADSERPSETGNVHVRGITDSRGRLMVLFAHNTDLPDAWEREGEDAEYFYRYSPESYSVGIDVILYAMTH
jgi:hypothetical protein